MKTSQLQSSEYHPYYAPYIEALGETDLVTALKKGRDEFVNFLEAIPEDKWQYAYAEGKWTIAQLVLHLIDAERVFQYRALRFSRKDRTDIPGFEQDNYVATSDAQHRDKHSLIEEYTAVRNAGIHLFENFTDEMLLAIGTANKTQMSVRALGFVISGHQRHHQKVIQERYL
ncbi:DinB family protein [Sungkyunkwania multivorans]|uniref:DinB family protein n=1 Tax=Sungkyunkwania multivorans TaxID=1173618 RepID=A0ABW3CWN2_9FLAO